MDIIKRNFLRLLRAGAFCENDSIEPMSLYKWSRLPGIAVKHGVVEEVLSGMRSHRYDSLCPAPLSVIDEMEQIASILRASKDAISAKDIEPSNILLRRRFRSIHSEERHSIDTSPTSLAMLDAISTVTHNMLTHGIRYCDILRLGAMLRNNGERIDFIKLEEWLRKTRLASMAQFEGSILISTLHFTKDEVPFVHAIDASALTAAVKSLKAGKQQGKEKLFKETRSGFVYNDAKATIKSIGHCMAHISRTPIEALSCLIGIMTSGLSEIEE